MGGWGLGKEERVEGWLENRSQMGNREDGGMG